jgi:hypothetical protein
MTEPTVVDFMGRAIKVGDTVVYPVRRRSDMILKKAVVCEDPAGQSYSIKQGVACFNERGRRVITQQPERCVVVQTLEERHASV